MARKKMLRFTAAAALAAIAATFALTVHTRHGTSYAAEAPAAGLACGGAACLALIGRRTYAADPPPADVAQLRADVERLKGMVPDQSHAMADVGYHFANLWFAAQSDNWPLAQFYADETRSHLRWAVRIIPKRKDREGREVDLTGILAALEQSSLKDLADAVKAADKGRFERAYAQQVENCMACHRASGKEFIRLHTPERPDAGVVDFKPAVGGGGR
jgi:hypothetical protein